MFQSTVQTTKLRWHVRLLGDRAVWLAVDLLASACVMQLAYTYWDE